MANNLKANVANLRETDKDYARRDNGFYREIAVIDPATGGAIVTARIYMPGQTAYCALWAAGRNGAYGRGAGKAGGYGYHKASAALGDAIADAGITLTGDVYGREKSNKPARINGVGDSAMEAACMAIGRALTGKRRLILHTAHA